MYLKTEAKNKTSNEVLQIERQIINIYYNNITVELTLQNQSINVTSSSSLNTTSEETPADDTADSTESTI